MLLLLGNMLVDDQSRIPSLVGLGIIAAGVPAYWFFRRSSGTAASARRLTREPAGPDRVHRAILQVLGVAGELEEADAHLVGRLLAPAHLDRRLARVAGVAGGIIEVGQHLDPGPLGQGDGVRNS